MGVNWVICTLLVYLPQNINKWNNNRNGNMPVCLFVTKTRCFKWWIGDSFSKGAFQHGFLLYLPIWRRFIFSFDSEYSSTVVLSAKKDHFSFTRNVLIYDQVQIQHTDVPAYLHALPGPPITWRTQYFYRAEIPSTTSTINMVLTCSFFMIVS